METMQTEFRSNGNRLRLPIKWAAGVVFRAVVTHSPMFRRQARHAPRPTCRLTRNYAIGCGERTPPACGLRRHAANLVIQKFLTGKWADWNARSRRRDAVGSTRNACAPFSTAWFRLRRCLLIADCIVIALLLAGCTTPAVRQQRLVAKPNMTFSESAAFSYNSPRLLSQLATGIASAGGPQNSGCTSCR